MYNCREGVLIVRGSCLFSPHPSTQQIEGTEHATAPPSRGSGLRRACPPRMNVVPQ